MRSSGAVWTLAACSLGLLVGCGDPFVGTWEEATADCGTPSTFTVDDDLVGSATLFIDSAACEQCSVTFEVEDQGDGLYAGSATVTTPVCAAACGSVGVVGCALSDDEETAECGIDVGPCSENDTFRKVSD